MIRYPETHILVPYSLLYIDDRRRPILDEDVEKLAEDIDSNGLINLPTVLDMTKAGSYPHIRKYYKIPSKHSCYFLVTGAHRTAALRLHGLEEIPVTVHTGEYYPSQKMQLEYSENNIRSGETWQFRCIKLAEIHEQHVYEKRSEGKKWTAMQSGDLMGISKAHTSVMLTMAKELASKDSPCWYMDSMTTAYNSLLKDGESELMKEAAQRKAVQRTSVLTPASLAEARATEIGVTPERYTENIGSANPLPSSKAVLHRTDIGMYCEEALDTMNRFEAEKFDAIITDPMYGVSAKTVSDRAPQLLARFKALQSNAAYDEVKDLLACIPEFYRILKPNGWFVFYFDIQYWDILFKACEDVGFKVQRWPQIWIKTHPCINAAAQFNTTKNMEYVMCCRKGNATLRHAVSKSCFPAARTGDAFVDANKEHPFVKPYLAWDALCEPRLIPGMLVYEPFAGRGSMLNWCSANNVNYMASEKSEDEFHYLVRNVESWQAATPSQTSSETTGE